MLFRFQKSTMSWSVLSINDNFDLRCNHFSRHLDANFGMYLFKNLYNLWIIVWSIWYIQTEKRKYYCVHFEKMTCGVSYIRSLWIIKGKTTYILKKCNITPGYIGNTQLIYIFFFQNIPFGHAFSTWPLEWRGLKLSLKAVAKTKPRSKTICESMAYTNIRRRLWYFVAESEITVAYTNRQRP